MSSIEFDEAGFTVRVDSTSVVVETGYDVSKERYKLTHDDFAELLKLYSTYKAIISPMGDKTRIKALHEYYKTMVRLRHLENRAYAKTNDYCLSMNHAPYMENIPKDLEFFLTIICDVINFVSVMTYAKSKNL